MAKRGHCLLPGASPPESQEMAGKWSKRTKILVHPSSTDYSVRQSCRQGGLACPGHLYLFFGEWLC